MDSPTKTAIITGVLGVTAAVAGGVIAAFADKWWGNKPVSNLEVSGNNNKVAQTGDVSGSLIAVGNNNTQHQNYYGVAAPAAGPFHGKVPTKPSPIEIDEAIFVAKPYDRIQIQKNYIGLQVSWPVSFSSIDEHSDGTRTVSFHVPDGDYHAVLADIDVEKCPKLRVVDSGHRAWVEGRIRYVGARLIRLEDDAEITLE